MSAEDDLIDYAEDDEVAVNDELKADEQKDTKKGHYVGIHTSNFRDFMLKPELSRAIVDCGFEHPSEVQHECIPQAVLGMDIICQAKSGMGKTAVFVLATLHQLAPVDGEVHVVVLCHTRELAFQIQREYERFSKYLPNVRSKVFYGGISVQTDIAELKKSVPHIVVGTPGRVLDLATTRKALDLSKVKHFVLDECDRMLAEVSMRRDVQSIFMATPHEKQVMMYSATLDKEVRPICKKFCQTPMEIYVDDDTKLTLHGLQQYFIRLTEAEKNRKLTDLLDALEFNQVVIFVSKVSRASELHKLLEACNFPSCCIHSALKQEERIERFKQFKEFNKRILVTTDLFGRGIDIERVNIVINYDFADQSDQYLHRVGRAGRFGTKGLAISFVSKPEDETILQGVQDRFAVKIPELPEQIDISSYRGIWKNTEDEILKAAVMKYGKNQWARVASLLNRKSAKQCKARWYEWLDPSIKKTEWNREEEEKLLHLAKLMPNQWRTIAPIVGRTAGQCMEHYERLLDQAQETADAASEDARKLRPGEIDPAPETKPARPDPVDMDEDEKEMLAEARARLANTMGKKAKRKARERQLEESRRLSILQKRRELKAAGVESKLGGGNKRKYIDYAKEIPFQKVVPAGFYDVSEEVRAAKSIRLDPKEHGLELAKLEGRHEKEEEQRERDKDKKRLKTLFKANAPQAVMMIAEQNDPSSLRRRSALSLPQPQVSDTELMDIVKAGQQALLMPPPEGGVSRAATQALVGDYSAQLRAAPTPLRTPMQEDVIMQEARNARVLRGMMPMSGDELPELLEGTGFEGMAPRASKLATPNTVLATPGHAAGYGSGALVPATPGSVTSSFGTGGSILNHARRGMGPGSLPVVLRDQLGLNESDPGDAFSVSVSEFEEGSVAGSMAGSLYSSIRSKERRDEIARQLKKLPEPEFVYEIAVPDLGTAKRSNIAGADGGGMLVEDVEDDDEAFELSVEDAADVAERKRLAIVAQAELEERRKSAVLKRGLPRPSVAPPPQALLVHCTADIAEAEALVAAEMVRQIRCDNYAYPLESKGPSVAPRRQSDDSADETLKRAFDAETTALGDECIGEAKVLIAQELCAMRGVERLQEAGPSDAELANFSAAWEDAHKKLLYEPATGSFGVPIGKKALLEALVTQFAALKSRIDKDGRKVSKLEARLQVVTKGYANRSDKLAFSFQEQFDAYVAACQNLVCFRDLLNSEQRAAQRRMRQADAELTEAQALEDSWQRKYAGLVSAMQQQANSA